MKTLPDEFQKALKFEPDNIRSLIDDAHIIKGGKGFYSSQSFITHNVRNGERVCEWRVPNYQPVLIMPEKVGRALLQHSNLQLVEKHAQYPKTEFNLVRQGDIAFALSAARSPIAIMISKEKVEELLYAMEHGQSDKAHLYEYVEGFMKDQNLEPQEVERLLENLKKEPFTLEALLAPETSVNDLKS